MLNVSQNRRYSEDNENQLGANGGKFVLFIPSVFFGAANISFKINKNFL